jgi:hypothetical protein
MESELIAIIVLASIAGGFGVLAMPFLLVRMVLDRKLRIAEMKLRVDERAVREGLQPVREEMARLRRETNDLVLGFDTTLQRLDARLQRLEQQVLAPQEPAAQSLPEAGARSWVESHRAVEAEPVVVTRKPR